MIIIDCLIGLLILISQATWMHHFSIYGVIPNLLPTWIVFTGFCHGRDKGLVIGLVLGILQDLLFGRLIGFFGLLYLLIGAGAGIFAKDVDHSRLLFPCLISSASTLVLGLIQLIVFRVIPGTSGFLSGLRLYVFPELIYTSVLSVPLYFIYYRLHLLAKRLWRRMGQRRLT